MPLTRLLKVFELVAKLGPISLDELVAEVGFSRSAVFRALKKLELDEWIRLRLDGRSYVATARTEEILSPEQDIFLDIEKLASIVSNTNRPGDVRVQLFHQITTLQMKLVDHSERIENPTVVQPSVLLCFESLQYAGAVAGSRKAYSFSEGLLTETYQTAMEAGYIEVYSPPEFCIPLFGSDDCLTVVHLSYRDGGKFRRAEITGWIESLLSLISKSDLRLLCSSVGAASVSQGTH